MSIENPLNESLLSFPILECIHIVAFAFSVGTVAIVDFRLMGVCMKNQSPADLWEDTWQWTLYGLIVVIVSGLLLFSSDPDNYYLNYAFLVKMVFLGVAIVYNYTAVRKAVAAPRSSGKSRTVGTVSLALWAMVAIGGIFIAAVVPGLNGNPL